ncbi:MAG TPA: L,D-transpeptidase family protein [Terrimicrobiaceae bacterium]|nr:L,D-transpeptidase family protein [Terrimicrobiaceae bacterium]
MKRRALIAGLLVILGAAAWIFRPRARTHSLPPKPRTVAQVLAVLAGPVRKTLAPQFRAAGVAYPPPGLVLLALKKESRLELHAPGPNGRTRHIASYPILAASGTAGPKLREGDHQVPEGFYRIELLNPNSRFHLSLRVNYPNADDLARAHEAGRNPAELGGDIMIHGGAASTGCLAVGDPAIEELFALVAATGLDRVQLIIAPCDFRTGATVQLPDSAPVWTGALHEKLQAAVGRFR